MEIKSQAKNGIIVDVIKEYGELTDREKSIYTLVLYSNYWNNQG